MRRNPDLIGRDLEIGETTRLQDLGPIEEIEAGVDPRQSKALDPCNGVFDLAGRRSRLQREHRADPVDSKLPRRLRVELGNRCGIPNLNDR